MTDVATSAPRTPQRVSYRRWVLLGLGLVTLATLALTTDLRLWLEHSLMWVRDRGPVGVIAYGLVYIVTVLLLIPATFLTLGAGTTFGVTLGFPLAWLSATTAATAAFLLGRSLARGWVEQRLIANPRLARLDEAVGESGWRIVLLTRLCPLFPFTLVNYAFGASRIPLPQYVLATAVGLFPGILLYVWIGDGLGDLAGLNANQVLRGPWQWTVYGVGLAIAAIVTLYVARIARNALRKDVE